MSHLASTLPASWASPAAFPALRHLLLDHNRLRGPLPAEWGSNASWPALEQL